MNSASSFRAAIFNPNLAALRKAEKWIRSNGIPDFETAEDAETRQRAMVSSFYKRGQDHFVKLCAGCNAAGCRESCETDVCHVQTRDRRLMAISSASQIFAAEEGPKYFVTLVRPEWQVAPNRLHELPILDIRKRVQERLRAANVSLAMGAFEVSYNSQLKRPAYWAGNVHLICAGVERDDLRDALRVKAWPDCRRPLQIVDAGNVTRRLGYCLKRFPQERREYIDRSGRRNRNPIPLKSSLLFDYDLWLAGIQARSRTILVGARQDSSGLIRSIGSRANCRSPRGTG